jgi:hypothetical protein
MHIKRHMQFNAPDTGATIAVPASQSATGQAITVTEPTPPPPAEIIQPPAIDRGISAPGPKIKPADVAKELGMSESPSRAIERAAKATRDKLTGRFKPERQTRHKPEARPAAAKPKLGEPDPKPTQQAVPALGEPEPKAEEPKIKIGDQEKTAAEWEAYHKELAQPKVEEKPPGAGKPEAPAAQDDAARHDKWMEETAAAFAPSQEEFDRMLADGDTKAFGRMIATVMLDTRKWVAEQIGGRLEQFEGQLQPITHQQQQIAQYQTEHQFLESNPTIKAHPDGLRTMRETAETLRAEHDDLLETIAAVPNSPLNAQRQARAKALETQFLQELAKATAAKLGMNGSAPSAPAAAAAPARAAAPRPRPPAQTGVTSNGGGGVIKGASSEIDAMRRAGFM